MFDNRIQRSVFGNGRQQAIGEWAILHAVYVIRLTTAGWADSVEDTEGRSEMFAKYWSHNMNGRDILEDLGIDGRMLI